PGVHPGATTTPPPHAQPRRVAVPARRRDLELAPPGNRPALRRPDRHFGPIPLERRVLLVAEELAQTGKELREPLIGLGRRHPHGRRWWAVGGEEDARPEPYRSEERRVGEEGMSSRSESRREYETGKR